ncbi:MAG: DUF1266 domain-containing protein [Lachnospiraceae bacterium]|nr:DUF1266 domain-containing protein [Lachnospiraceae bacterium]
MQKKFPDLQSPKTVKAWAAVILVCSVTVVISAVVVLHFWTNREKGSVSNVAETTETAAPENADTIQEKPDPVVEIIEISDTIRWFNTANALQIYSDGGDYQLYGGFEPNKDNQLVAKYSLSAKYDITDRASGEAALDWLLSEGYRTNCAKDMNLFADAGMGKIDKDQRAAFLMDSFGLTEESAKDHVILYDLYLENGEKVFAGWDYSLALYMTANLYLAGYYTSEEALDTSLVIAETIQANFDSWDDYIESYFIGYVYYYWTQGYTNAGMTEDYEALQSAEDNPYSIDFNMKLEKSW